MRCPLPCKHPTPHQYRRNNPEHRRHAQRRADGTEDHRPAHAHQVVAGESEAQRLAGAAFGGTRVHQDHGQRNADAHAEAEQERRHAEHVAVDGKPSCLGIDRLLMNILSLKRFNHCCHGPLFFFVGHPAKV